MKKDMQVGVGNSDVDDTFSGKIESTVITSFAL